MVNEEFLKELNEKDDEAWITLDEVAYLTCISPNTVRSSLYTNTRYLREYARKVNGVWMVKKCNALEWAKLCVHQKITVDDVERLIVKRKMSALTRYKNHQKRNMGNINHIENSEEYITRGNIVTIVGDITSSSNITDLDLAVLVDVCIMYLERRVDLIAVETIFDRILKGEFQITNYPEPIGIRNGRTFRALEQLLYSKYMPQKYLSSNVTKEVTE